MIAESTRQLLSPVNKWLPFVWKFLGAILLLYIIYSITAVILRFLARKIKKNINNVCSFKWVTYEDVKNVADMYKKSQTQKVSKHHHNIGNTHM